MIIDCHAHIVEHLSGTGARGEVRPIGSGKVRFLDGGEQIVIPKQYGDQEFLAETLIELMDEAGIDKAVLLQGLFYGLQNEYIYECVRKYPNRFVGAGSFDPYIEQAEEILERLIKHYRFKILKFELSTGFGLSGLHGELKIDGKEFERVFLTAAKEETVVVLDIGERGMKSYQIDEIIKAAKLHPNVKIVLCHLLAVNGKDIDLWKDDMKCLGKCDNIWFDITAVPWNVKEAYPFAMSMDLINEAKKIIGSQRMMWGSDVPQLLVMEEYRKLYNFLFLDDRFSESEIDDLLYKSATNVYGIK